MCNYYYLFLYPSNSSFIYMYMYMYYKNLIETCDMTDMWNWNLSSSLIFMFEISDFDDSYRGDAE